MDISTTASSSASRDLARYERSYQSASFEPTQAALRKRVVTTQLKLWQAKRVLEVGCGMAPIFTDYREFSKLTIVEPGRHFAEHARHLAGTDDRILVIQDFLENATGSAPFVARPSTPFWSAACCTRFPSRRNCFRPCAPCARPPPDCTSTCPTHARCTVCWPSRWG